MTISTRKIYANRTLNLRSIKAIGYDMDYTLIHYRVKEWEQTAYEHLKRKLADKNIPVDDLEFQPDQVMQGLIIDLELGNLVKANRFGFIMNGVHGTEQLSFQRLRNVYSRVLVDLSDERFVFMNTLFTLSESCMFSQLVSRLDQGTLPYGMSYRDLYRMIRSTIDEAHMEGLLKSEILAKPEKYIEIDPKTFQALQDQRLAGKKLMLITNSDWDYTNAVMNYTFNRFLESTKNWRDLFDLVIVSSRKPAFFARGHPLFEIVNDEGLLKPVIGDLEENKIYYGGNATMIEKHFGFHGDEFLYVGDHLFSDVRATKKIHRWRTALVVRELEDELEAVSVFQEKEKMLASFMEKKAKLEIDFNQLRLRILREKAIDPDENKLKHLLKKKEKLFTQLKAIDEQIMPLVQEADRLMNDRWGQLMRAGKDKSHFARQVEQYADIYMSRVSHFLDATPYGYLRSPKPTLPHEWEFDHP